MAAIPSTKELIQKFNVLHQEIQIPSSIDQFACITTEPILRPGVQTNASERESQLKIVLATRIQCKNGEFVFRGIAPTVQLRGHSFNDIFDYCCKIDDYRFSDTIVSKNYGRLLHRVTSILPPQLFQRRMIAELQLTPLPDVLQSIVLQYAVSFNRADYISINETTTLTIGEEEEIANSDGESVASDDEVAYRDELPEIDSDSDARDSAASPETISDSRSGSPLE